MNAADVNEFQTLPEPVGFMYTDEDGVRRKVDEWEPSPMPPGWTPTRHDPQLPEVTMFVPRSFRVDPLL